MPTEQEIQFVRNVRANNPISIDLWLGMHLYCDSDGEVLLIFHNDELEQYIDYILENQPFFDFEDTKKINEWEIKLIEPEFNFSAEDVVDDEEKTWW